MSIFDTMAMAIKSKNMGKTENDGAGSVSGSSRSDNGYDNCKVVFMFYVVLFHMANNWFLHESTHEWSHTFTKRMFHRYTLWHEKLAVPGFAFLSGFFGKSFGTVDGSDRWRRSITMLFVGSINVQLVEVILRQVLTTCLGRDGKGQDGTTHSFPTSINFYDNLETWYLLALLCWRIMTPFIQLIRQPVLVSLLLSFLHVHVDWGGGQSDLRMRVFRFFPFYVAGLVTEKSAINRIPRQTTIGFVGVILTLYIAFIIEDSDRVLGIFYAIPSWAISDHAVLLFQYFYAGSVVISVILLVKQIKIRLLPWSHSNSTLAIYVWHWQLLTLVVYGKCPFTNDVSLTSGWPVMDFLRHYGDKHPILAIVCLHVVAYVICVVLGSRAFWTIVRRIIDPDISSLFQKPLIISATGQRQQQCLTKQLAPEDDDVEYQNTINHTGDHNTTSTPTTRSVSCRIIESTEDNDLMLYKTV
jgi:hypothetical protein